MSVSFSPAKELHWAHFTFAYFGVCPYVGAMKELYKNPHTFDMNDYYSGITYVIGGRDYEQEEKNPFAKTQESKKVEKAPIELDWSFLKRIKNPPHRSK